uniref:Uncharacterized protein n=1 Tax=Peronospora matthiolae TaxID=2874970 RepID=A0AAV1THN4_9STRA
MELVHLIVLNNAEHKRVDKSCVGEMPVLNMKVAPELLSTFFGIEDVYDRCARNDNPRRAQRKSETGVLRNYRGEGKS